MWEFLAQLATSILSMFIDRLDRPDTAEDLKATKDDKKKHKRLVDAKNKTKGIRLPK
jgi:hypothetical protein